MSTGSPAVVAFGGGHGLAASLAALRQLTDRLTAVVTVADDGGSSGRLRTEFGLLPPGDLRMALAALAGTDELGQRWRQVVQHRFPGDGPLGGHAAGNLVLAALMQVTGDPVASLDLLGGLLGASGRVLPLSTEPLDIVAEVAGEDRDDVVVVRGQVAVATAPGRVLGVSLVPADPPACPAALDAVLEADWVVVGPGSWFTSVLPHVLVPGVRKALGACSARRLLALNLAPQLGETSGFSPEAHLDVLTAYAPELDFDVVLADRSVVPDAAAEARLRGVAADLGARLAVEDLRERDGSPRHDPQLLAAAYRRLFADFPPSPARGDQ